MVTCKKERQICGQLRGLRYFEDLSEVRPLFMLAPSVASSESSFVRLSFCPTHTRDPRHRTAAPSQRVDLSAARGRQTVGSPQGCGGGGGRARCEHGKQGARAEVPANATGVAGPAGGGGAADGRWGREVETRQRLGPPQRSGSR